jgi:hypothetical protein
MMAEGRSSAASRRNGWFVLVLALAVLLVAFLGGRPKDNGEPLSPDGVGPSGAKALRELLTSFSAGVAVRDDLSRDADVALLLVDDLTDEQRADVQGWVRGGGRLVVADPTSQFTPLVASSSITQPFGPNPDEPRLPEVCTIAALADLDSIEPGGVSDYEVPRESDQCFGPSGAAIVTASAKGDGVVVAVGGASVFENDHLGRADNAVLAVNLIAPDPSTHVVWLERDRSAPAEQDSLWALVGPGPRAALLQLAIAALAYILYRARRLGRPPQETQPVQLAGSELVVAVGHLMQQGDPNRAAELLRDDLRRVLRERLGLPAETSNDALARIVSVRSGIPPERAAFVLGDQPVRTEQGLVTLARDVELLRQEVLHGPATERAGAPAPTPGA